MLSLRLLFAMHVINIIIHKRREQWATGKAIACEAEFFSSLFFSFVCLFCVFFSYDTRVFILSLFLPLWFVNVLFYYVLKWWHFYRCMIRVVGSPRDGPLGWDELNNNNKNNIMEAMGTHNNKEWKLIFRSALFIAKWSL